MATAPEIARIIRVFVSSPSELQPERDAVDKVVAEVNRHDGQRLGVYLQTFRWEKDTVPQVGPSATEVIGAQTPPCDVYVGIMAGCFGDGPISASVSTEEELQNAVEQWGEVGTPWVLFYFHSNPPAPRTSEDGLEFVKVLQFKERLQGMGIAGQYDSVDAGEKSLLFQVSNHLRRVVQGLFPEPTLPSGIASSAATPAKAIVSAEYIDWLLARCRDVELMGLDLKHGSGVRLNHVYTPLATSSRPDGQELAAKLPRRLADGSQPEGPQLLLGLLDKQSLYVSGDPGSGKSTFCRWVTWLACSGSMPNVDVVAPEGYQESDPDTLRGRLPVLVRLRDLWQHLPAAGVDTVAIKGIEDALERWLAEQACRGLTWRCLKAHLDQGTALLMLDGVDEVPSVRSINGGDWYPRAMLLSGLADAMPSWTKAGNRVLVTSRPYGVEGGQQQRLNLAHAPILGLDQDLQVLLARRWFVRLKEDRDLGLETADAMIDHIHVERGLEELAPNPLLLTAMCIIYDQGKRLPRDKYLLYDKITDTVLHKRYPVKERIEPIRGCLGAVALGMHTGESLGQQRVTPEATAADREIDAILQSFLQRDGSVYEGLRDIVQTREDLLSQSGLLVSRGDGRASFYHLSIQEFLAAERLHLLTFRKWEKLIELMVQRGATAAWRNTLSFVFGCLVAKSSPTMGLDCLREVAGRIRSPAVDAVRRGQPGEAWNQGIVLGDCLQIVAGREAAIPRDLIAFFENLVLQAIDQEIAIRDRQTLAIALGRLGDPRVAIDLRVTAHPDDHPGYVKVPAGKYFVGDEKKPITLAEPFWLSKYPVTNGQYGRFIEDGGYKRHELWSEADWAWVQREGIGAPDLWRNPNFNAPTQPVVGVTWWEAEAYCRWAGGRLPTADEAEAAARGPRGFVFPWADKWEEGICNSESKLGTTSAVGIFPRDRSASGAMDVAGNVYEWCADTSASGRVIRGGNWGDGARYCRAAYRDWYAPEFRFDHLGFRVALTGGVRARGE